MHHPKENPWQITSEKIIYDDHSLNSTGKLEISN
jgi:hypothetical protein